ncbi:MAG: hypothetical protein GY948_21460 [Alphaproteobacteria bacterium]|nr:hypothetical protein [Alphaproteobacteria bacterium]
MPVLSRYYFNFSVFKQRLTDFLRDFQQKVSLRVTAEHAAFVLPEQPYTTREGGPPLLFWSPRCAMKTSGAQTPVPSHL